MRVIVTILVILLAAGGVVVTRIGLFKAFADIWKKPPRGRW